MYARSGTHRILVPGTAVLLLAVVVLSYLVYYYYCFAVVYLVQYTLPVQ